jgi:hypothetical protein
MPPPLPDNVVIEAMYRYKINFATAASLAGGTIRWANQHALLWGIGKLDDEYRIGMCAGLAMEWMKAVRVKQDLVGRFMGARKEAFGNKDGKPSPKPAVESFYQLLDHSHNQQGKKMGAFLQNEFAIVATKTFTWPYANLGATLLKKHYYYISSGSHAMAAFLPAAGKVNFYDPNVAEITGTSPKFFDTYFKDNIEATAVVMNKPLEELKAKKVFTTMAYKAL